MQKHYAPIEQWRLAQAYLVCFAWVPLLSLIGSGCLSGPPLRVQLQPGSTVTAAHSATEAPARLTVTTFNVWGLPSWLNGASSGRYPNITKELDRLGSDVVLLQEVWTRRSFIELSGQAKGPARSWWTAAARHKGSFLGQNGLLTLSRYPIAQAKVMHFSAAQLPDSLMHKGALKVTIVVGASGQRFNVWNVHLQDGASKRVRASQLGELIGWIQRSHDGQVADVVGGDFNFTPDSDEFRQFVAAIGPDVHQLAGDEIFPTWDGLKPTPVVGQALDHIFISIRQPLDEVHARPRRLFAASRVEERLSDHMGLEASLTFGSTREQGQPILLGQRASSAPLETAAVTGQ